MTITEASRRSGLSQDTLRYYERVGLINNVPRNKSGNRDYEEQNLRQIEFVKCMRGAGVSIEALIEYRALLLRGEETLQARKQLLIEQRNVLAQKMDEIQRTLDRLDGKIDGYEQWTKPKE